MIFSKRFRAAATASVLLAATGLGGFAFAQDQAAPGAAVVARVGDAAITEDDLTQASQDFGQDLAQVPEAQRRSVLLDVLVDMELLAQAAREKGLDKTEAFARRLDLLTTRALRNEYVQKEIVEKTAEADLKAEYDRLVASVPPQEEARARHILLASEQEAKDVIAALDKGGDFAALAEEKSTDPSAKGQGGDLGFFTKGRMVPEFDAAAFALTPGAYTKTPVQTQFGWHVIKLEEKRPSAPPALGEVEGELRTALVRKAFEETMKNLRAKTKVEIVGAAPAAVDGAAPATGATAPAAGADSGGQTAPAVQPAQPAN